MLFEKTYGIDLGSSSVKVYSMIRNKSYIEKNMIAAKGRKIIAVGNEAYEMFEKAPSDISVSSPMAFGMIANLELQEIVLYSMMKKIDKIPTKNINDIWNKYIFLYLLFSMFKNLYNFWFISILS